MAVQYGGAESLQVRLKGPYGSVSIRLGALTLPAEGWKGAVSPFSQELQAEGITATCKIDLQPTAEQLERMRQLGMALAAENNQGAVTVYAFGAKPREAMTIQTTVTEVQR